MLQFDFRKYRNIDEYNSPSFKTKYDSFIKKYLALNLIPQTKRNKIQKRQSV